MDMPYSERQEGQAQPFMTVLVVDFKGFIHLKKQAQQRGK